MGFLLEQFSRLSRLHVQGIATPQKKKDTRMTMHDEGLFHGAPFSGLASSDKLLTMGLKHV